MLIVQIWACAETPSSLSHSNPNTSSVCGASTASVPLENPQWHIKIALFVCKSAALNNSWSHFCTERATRRSNLPIERDIRCKTKHFFVMDLEWLIPTLSAFSNRSFSFFPPIVVILWSHISEEWKNFPQNIECWISRWREMRRKELNDAIHPAHFHRRATICAALLVVFQLLWPYNPQAAILIFNIHKSQ